MNHTNQENAPTPFRPIHLNQFIEDHSSELLLTHIEDLESQGPSLQAFQSKNDTEVQVVMLTVVKNKDQVVKASGNVVQGHFVREGQAWQIHYGIQRQHNNEVAINSQLAWKVFDFIQAQRATSQDYDLSVREKEILKHVVDGDTYKEIASKLYISLETVRTHIRHIYEKMKVKSKSQAVGKALRDRLAFL